MGKHPSIDDHVPKVTAVCVHQQVVRVTNWPARGPHLRPALHDRLVRRDPPRGPVSEPLARLARSSTLHGFHGVGAVKVGVFQTASDVIIQESVRKGFDLTVAEGPRKRKPVVGADAGGIALQTIDGEKGFLVDSVEQCAEKTLYLLEHPGEADRMGTAGRKRVRENCLSTRHLADYLELFNRIRPG